MRTYRKYQIAALLAVFAAAFVVVSGVPAQNPAQKPEVRLTRGDRGRSERTRNPIGRRA